MSVFCLLYLAIIINQIKEKLNKVKYFSSLNYLGLTTYINNYIVKYIVTMK